MSAAATGHLSGLGEEYENEPVPMSARRSLFSVSAVWVGFPMIMTSAVFAGIVVYNLGFHTGMLAILAGDLILMTYVGSLSCLAGRSGKNFALTAADTFGVRGFRAHRDVQRRSHHPGLEGEPSDHECGQERRDDNMIRFAPCA